MDARTKKEMKKFLRQAVIEAQKAAMEVQSVGNEENFTSLRHETAALAHGNQALSWALTAEAIYINGAELCECYEFECIVHQMKAFVKELTTNVERKRSHEWSLIEHQKLLDEISGTEFEFEL